MRWRVNTAQQCTLYLTTFDHYQNFTASGTYALSQNASFTKKHHPQNAMPAGHDTGDKNCLSHRPPKY